MAEVNILKFVTDNIFLVGVAFVSGAMLVWPAVRRGVAGATISTLQATLLINQQNALVLDVREAAAPSSPRRAHADASAMCPSRTRAASRTSSTRAFCWLISRVA